MTATVQSVPRSEKPRRGRSADTIALADAAARALAERHPQTLRQLYCVLVSSGHVDKTEAGYRRLKDVVKVAREDGSIPWSRLVDHTRSVFASRTWDGIEGLLADSARLYRRDLMRQQPVAVQLWAESDSVGSVIAPVADEYGIPTYIGRGYGARGYLWNAASDLVAAYRAGKEAHVFHVGDHDPSGEDIYRDVLETLRLYVAAQLWQWPVARVRSVDPATITASSEWMYFERLALTAAQIRAYGLPSRPPKTTDVRTARFTGIGSVEVEALPIDALLVLVEAAIEDVIDPAALAIARQAETSEREIAHRIAATPVARLLEVAS